MKSFNIGDLTIPVPIIQGGMGIGISLSKLSSAVANMGGVGVISTVGLGFINNPNKLSLKNANIEGLRNVIREAREKTKGILGVNVMSVLTDFSEMVKTSIEEGIDIIFSGAGLPLDLPRYLSSGAKTKLVPIVSSGRAAAVLCNKWQQNFNYLPDAFVVEGPKAGGHLGFKATDILDTDFSLEKILHDVLAVTNEIKERFKKHIPVIAAGGIFNGKDIFDIIKKGAAGVQMGTRFVATEECDASDNFKNAFISAKEENIEIIKSPVGLPGRAIYNNFLKEAHEGNRRPKGCRYHCIKSCNPKTTLYCIANALIQSFKGNMNDGFAFTGTNGSRIERISTVKQLFNDLKQEYIEEGKKPK